MRAKVSVSLHILLESVKEGILTCIYTLLSNKDTLLGLSNVRDFTIDDESSRSRICGADSSEKQKVLPGVLMQNRLRGADSDTPPITLGT